MSERYCVHLFKLREQPSAVLPDETGAEAHLCAPCAVERIEARLNRQSILKVARSVKLNQCGHHDGDKRCGECFTGLLGTLMLIWSHAKLRKDQVTATRLGKVMKSLRVLHSRKHDAPEQQTPKQSTQ